MSLPSEQGGQIPYTGHPSIIVQDAHFSSLYSEAPLELRHPVFKS